MSGTSVRLSDTIAALSTAPGRSGIAVLRISGSEADQILLRLARQLDGVLPSERRQTLISLRHPETNQLLDQPLVTRFKSPGSYTGEDTVEISCHGGDLTPRLLLDAILAAGARPAFPGEFTRRAYLNGRIDLVQAEAVADVIDSRSPAMHRAAIHQMERGLSTRLGDLRDAILRTEALAAYSIDFPEEDEPPVPNSTIRSGAAEVLARMKVILATAPEGEMLRRGPLVVLAGHPNSGKSSLFNALLGIERAIVTEIPGTTRDAIEAEVVLEGFPFRIVDTAGLRSTADRVEMLGIEVAHRYLAAAEIILLCTESRSALTAEERAFRDAYHDKSLLIIRTKEDLQSSPRIRPLETTSDLFVSTVSGTGLGDLRERLLGLGFGNIRASPEEQPIVTRERHARALRNGASEIQLFLDALDSNLPLALAATHLRSAAGALEDVIGLVTSDDILDTVFGQFCVGK